MKLATRSPSVLPAPAVALALGMACLARVASGEVVESAENGFTVRSTAVVVAPAAKVWSMIGQVGSWWDPAHTWSKKPANLSLDVRPGGCFCERLDGEGSGVEHLRVVYVAPSRLLRLRGALGPFQGMAVDGAMTFTLAEKEGKTELTLAYVLGGTMKGGLAPMAPIVDGVISGHFKRLVRLVETGSPEEPKAATAAPAK